MAMNRCPAQRAAPRSPRLMNPLGGGGGSGGGGVTLELCYRGGRHRHWLIEVVKVL